VATEDDLLWDLRWNAKLDKPSQFSAKPLADQIRKISADSTQAGTALLAGNRGVYRWSEGKMQKLVEGSFVDVVGVDHSILAAGRDGSIARWDK
jgi:hypothetical protein